MPHSKDTLTIKFTSTLNQDANDESWGIRDVELTTYDTDVFVDTFKREVGTKGKT